MSKSITGLRQMPFSEMMAMFGTLIDGCQFEAHPEENQTLLQDRLRRTLDKAPPLYAYLMEATSYLSYWTDMASSIGGQSSDQYKDMRNKRDAAERLSKAVKLFYEAASRRITVMQAEDEYQHRR